jgi:hypothetical protein
MRTAVAQVRSRVEFAGVQPDSAQLDLDILRTKTPENCVIRLKNERYFENLAGAFRSVHNLFPVASYLKGERHVQIEWTSLSGSLRVRGTFSRSLYAWHALFSRCFSLDVCPSLHLGAWLSIGGSRCCSVFFFASGVDIGLRFHKKGV